MVLSTLTVMNAQDSGPQSLRAEIAAAHSGDTIQFSSSLAGQTINLSSGELLINKNLTITGLTTTSGAPNISINAGFTSRVFDLQGGNNGITVTLKNLTVQGGQANAQSPNNTATGAGLLINDTSGTVTLNNLNITNNDSLGAVGANGGNSQPGGEGGTAVGGGVAFFGGSAGKLVVTNTSVSSNAAFGGQGGQGGYGGTAGSGSGGNGNGYGGAGGNGGSGLGAGLYLNGGTIQLTGDTINYNEAVGNAAGNGGQGGVTVNFHNGPGGAGGIGGSGQGGGVYVNSGTVLLNNDNFNVNLADGSHGGAGGAGGNRGFGGTGAAGAAGLNGNGEGAGLFVTGGSVQLTGGGIKSNRATGGTGVYNDGGFGRGGGLYVSGGSVMVSTTTLLNNEASGGYNGDDAAGIGLGGGVYVSGGDVRLLRDALIYNFAIGANSTGTVYADTGLGGAAAILGGNLVFIDDTLAFNEAIGGTGSSTVYNSIGDGGAVYGQGGTLQFLNDTISSNAATGATGTGGGIFIGSPVGPPAAASFANTILAGNSAAFATDVFGPARSSDHDLVQTYDPNYASGFGTPGDLLNVPVSLAPLGNYGGPTATMPLLPGSNGIDMGDTAATGKTKLPGLADLWKGEGNAHDSVGTQNGTVQGTVTYATGEVGNAFNFNGTGSVQFGPHAVGTSDFSMSFWIQTANAGSQAVLGDRTTFGSGNFYGVRMNNGQLVVELDQDGSGTNYVGVVSKQTVNDGLFHQVTIVRSGTTVSLYIDGSLDSQGNSAGVTNLNSTSPLIIGAESGNNFPDFKGKLDEIAFYNQALSGQQVLAAYAGPITHLTDQRGGVRVVGTAVDMGATEYQYDLKVTGSAPSSATPGSTITYTLTVTNSGLDPVPNVTFSDTLPNGVSFLALNAPSGWAIGRPSGQTISAFSGGGLAPGASATFTVTATVNNNTAVGTVLTNKVSISPVTDDSNPGNNKLSLRTTVVAPPATNVEINAPTNDVPTNPSPSPSSMVGVDANGKIVYGLPSVVWENVTPVPPVNGMPTLTDQVLSESSIDGLKANAMSFLVMGLKRVDNLPDSTKTLLGI